MAALATISLAIAASLPAVDPCTGPYVLEADPTAEARALGPAEVEALTGSAFVQSGAVWTSLQPGDAVAAGSRIRLAPGGRLALRAVPVFSAGGAGAFLSLSEGSVRLPVGAPCESLSTPSGVEVSGALVSEVRLGDELRLTAEATATGREERAGFEDCEGSTKVESKKDRIREVAVCAGDAADAAKQADKKANVQSSAAALTEAGNTCAALLKCPELVCPQGQQQTCKTLVANILVTKVHEVKNCVNTTTECTPAQRGKTIWKCDVKVDWKFDCSCGCR